MLTSVTCPGVKRHVLWYPTIRRPALFWILQFVKGSRTGHFVKVSLWYASLLTNTRFRFLYFRIIVKCIWCHINTKSFQMTQGGYQVIIVLLIKSNMTAAKKQCFLWFLYWAESSPPPFKVRSLQMTITLALV